MNTFIIIDGWRINTSRITFYQKSSYTNGTYSADFNVKIHFSDEHHITIVKATKQDQEMLLQKLDEYLMVKEI